MIPNRARPPCRPRSSSPQPCQSRIASLIQPLAPAGENRSWPHEHHLGQPLGDELVRYSILKLAERVTRDRRQGCWSSHSLCERIGEQRLTVKGAATARLTSGIRRRTVAILSQRLMDRAQPPECWSTIDVGMLRAVDLSMAPANKLRMDERTMPDHSSHKGEARYVHR